MKTKSKAGPLGRKRVFVKLYKNSADIYIAYDDLPNIFGGLQGTLRSLPYGWQEFKKWKLIAVGAVHYHGCEKSYYGFGSKVPNRLKGNGYGILLYKAMLLVAVKLGKTKKGKILFSPHEGCNGVTSEEAWRCYISLYRKGYLKPIEPITVEDLIKNVESESNLEKIRFEVVKLPRNIKSIYLKCE